MIPWICSALWHFIVLGWAVTPWAALANIGNQSGYAEYLFEKTNPVTAIRDVENDRAFCLVDGHRGVELTMFDPLTFGRRDVYGRMNDSWKAWATWAN